MVVHGSPVDGSIPDLSDEQYLALREFVVQHIDEGTCSTTPLRLARVLACDKPATLILTPPEITPRSEQSPEKYLVDLLDRIDYPYRQFTGLPGWIVSSSPGRLDLLPTTKTTCDAYHRRLGVVFGYPRDAIEYFINKDKSQSTKIDLVQSGEFDATEVAYTKFVCYSYPKTPEKFEHHILVGRENRRQIGQLARTWDLPELDTLADNAYNDEIRALEEGERPSTSNLTIKFDWKAGQQISDYSCN